jgi:hypothetical protein
MSNTTIINPSEGVSNHTSETSRNNNENLIQELHRLDIHWLFDVGDFVSFVKEQRNNGQVKEDDVMDYISDKYDGVRETMDTLDLIEHYDLWDSIEDLIENQLYDDLEVQFELVLDKLDSQPIQIELLDGVKHNRKHPNTFHIPTYREKSKIEVGSSVKVVDIKYGERFWVIVEEFISNELMVGRIINHLVGGKLKTGVQPYSWGDYIYFTMDNIIDIE